MSTHKLNHLAIIPDGNARWAKANGKTIYEAYSTANARTLELARHARHAHGIHTQTLWGLSTENWQHRPKAELTFLVNLFSKAIDSWVTDAHEDRMRLVHLGNRTRLPQKLLRRMAEAEAETAHYDQFVFNIGLDYGGHDEIMRAVEKQRAAGASGPLDEFLDTAGQPHPNPDFIIRTSGEVRLSGFMPWQADYAEYYFEPVFFPDLSIPKLDTAIEDYYNRQRRFGGGHSAS